MSFTDMTKWVVWSPQDKASGGLELFALEGRPSRAKKKPRSG
jgi:hypothetical protein